MKAIIGIDYEYNPTYEKSNEPIEIALINIHNGSKFHSFIKCKRKLGSWQRENLKHINNIIIKNSPTIDIVSQYMVKYLNEQSELFDQIILVGHNSKYSDFPIFKSMLNYVNNNYIKFNDKIIYHDTLPLIKKYIKNNKNYLKSTKLCDVYDYFFQDDQFKNHRALDDAKASAYIYIFLNTF